MDKIIVIIFYSILTMQTLKAQTADEKQVADAVEQLKNAMLDADGQTLDKLTASQLSYGHSSGLIEDKAAFIKALTSGTSDWVTINFSGQIIRMIDGTAIVRHQLSGDTNDNGKAGSTKLGVMLIWQKQSGQWKLFARQAFKLP